MKNLIALFLILNALFSTECYSQGQTFKVIDDSVSVIVSGESTLHDWTVTATSVSGYPDQLQLMLDEEDTIREFSFAVQVAGMESGRGTAMDDKVYTALKSANFPYINYVQNKPAILKMSGDSGFNLTSEGTLTIAGKSIDVLVDVLGSIEDGFLKFSASQDIRMTDYNVDPPTAMFGQIETKDDISVAVKFVYQSN